MKVQVQKLKSVNSKMSRKSEFSWLIIDSNNYTMYCYVCRKAGPDIAGKTKFVTGKKLKCESPVYHNKIKSETWKMFQYGIRKKPIPQLSIFCLIQGINNYVQINTYWRYIAGNTNYGKSELQIIFKSKG
jgi:hypothetical protein